MSDDLDELRWSQFPTEESLVCRYLYAAELCGPTSKETRNVQARFLLDALAEFRARKAAGK